MTTTARSVDDARRVALARALGYAPTLTWEQLIDGVKDRLKDAERRRAQGEVIHAEDRRQIAALTRRAEAAADKVDRMRDALARRAVPNLDRRRLEAILDRRRPPTSLDVALIATAAGVTVDSLLTGSTEEAAL